MTAHPAPSLLAAQLQASVAITALKRIEARTYERKGGKAEKLNDIRAWAAEALAAVGGTE